jgi:hypothetical protein
MSNLATFARRRNQDDTVDSICMTCYQTVSRDGDVASAEQGHTCNPYGEFNQHQVDFRIACPPASLLSH